MYHAQTTERTEEEKTIRVEKRRSNGQRQPSIHTCLLVAAESEAAHRNGADFRASSAELAIFHLTAAFSNSEITIQ